MKVGFLQTSPYQFTMNHLLNDRRFQVIDSRTQGFVTM